MNQPRPAHSGCSSQKRPMVWTREMSGEQEPGREMSALIDASSTYIATATSSSSGCIHGWGPWSSVGSARVRREGDNRGDPEEAETPEVIVVAPGMGECEREVDLELETERGVERLSD